MPTTASSTEDIDMETAARWVVRLAAKVIIGIILLFVLWRIASPQITLYRISTERKAQVAEAKAKAEAAEYLADAEVARAQGVAEANRVIAASITDEYVRWLYVDQLDQVQGQIIYVPTEGGIPILEAGHRPTTTTP